MTRRSQRTSGFDDDDYRTGGILYRPPIYFVLLFVVCTALIAATFL